MSEPIIIQFYLSLFALSASFNYALSLSRPSLSRVDLPVILSSRSSLVTSVFVFDILQIPSTCIQIFSGYIAFICIPPSLATALTESCNYAMNKTTCFIIVVVSVWYATAFYSCSWLITLKTFLQQTKFSRATIQFSPTVRCELRYCLFILMCYSATK